MFLCLYDRVCVFLFVRVCDGECVCVRESEVLCESERVCVFV